MSLTPRARGMVDSQACACARRVRSAMMRRAAVPLAAKWLVLPKRSACRRFAFPASARFQPAAWRSLHPWAIRRNSFPARLPAGRSAATRCTGRVRAAAANPSSRDPGRVLRAPRIGARHRGLGRRVPCLRRGGLHRGLVRLCSGHQREPARPAVRGRNRAWLTAGVRGQCRPRKCSNPCRGARSRPKAFHHWRQRCSAGAANVRVIVVISPGEPRRASFAALAGIGTECAHCCVRGAGRPRTLGAGALRAHVLHPRRIEACAAKLQ